MRLHENQLKLIRHLARFNLLDYVDCLRILDMAGTGDKVALSYAFRPLTKNKHLTKRKDGSVAILAKGRALFPDVKPLISAGGGAQSVQRVMEVSRMAALMEEHGIPAVAEVPKSPEPVFIPSPVGGTSLRVFSPPPDLLGCCFTRSTVATRQKQLE